MKVEISTYLRSIRKIEKEKSNYLKEWRGRWDDSDFVPGLIKIEKKICKLSIEMFFDKMNEILSKVDVVTIIAHKIESDTNYDLIISDGEILTNYESYHSSLFKKAIYNGILLNNFIELTNEVIESSEKECIQYLENYNPK